jgi:hypothetical protein
MEGILFLIIRMTIGRIDGVFNLHFSRDNALSTLEETWCSFRILKRTPRLHCFDS